MMSLLILLFFISLNSFFIPFFFGKKLGQKGLFFFVITSSVTNVLLSIYLYIQLLKNDNIIHVTLYNWIVTELITISWGLLYDPISSSMLIIITYISFCAHCYSYEYLNGDPHLNRFFCYLSLFTFFMILLVLSDNVVQLFIGWEGVGICSYLLINFWSNRIQANKSSILAVLANKIGDLTLLIASLILQSMYKNVSFTYIKEITFFFDVLYSFEFTKLSELIVFDSFESLDLWWSTIEFFNIQSIYWFDYEILEIVSVMLIVSCIGKSAQFGFHFWLPEAMEGPTPVSSLIHAATMVTAGIFLILRFSDFFLFISNTISIIILIGSITLFFASSIGITQTDIKKIIAYSTCSQLGYMFLSCGFQNYMYGMYHLFIHAFFKALLFLTAGYLIHLLSNEQDLRKMGGMLKLFPFSYSMMLIGSYSLAGLPFLSGFYSKDPLIENVIMNYYSSYFFSKNILISIALIFSLATVLITALYSIKSLLDIYYSSYKGFYFYITNVHYSTIFIQMPLILLCIATIYSGYVFQDAFIGLNNDFLSNSIFIAKSNIHYLFDFTYTLTENYMHNNAFISEFFPYYRFYLFHILLYSLVSFVMIKLWVVDFYYFVLDFKIWNVYSSIVKKYIYINRLVITEDVFLALSNAKDIFLSLFDKGIIEIIGPYGLSIQIASFYNVFKLQSGYLYHYVGYIYMTMIISLLSLVVYY